MISDIQGNNLFGSGGSLASKTSQMASGTGFSVDEKSVIDASILGKLSEGGYILTIVSNDSEVTAGMIKSLYQYIWPSAIGNIPAFRDASGIIYVATDRGQLYRIDIAATPTNNGPQIIPPTGGGGAGAPTGGGGGNSGIPPIKQDGPIMGPPLTYDPRVIPDGTGGGGTPTIPAGGIIGSGKIYSSFTVDDVVPNQQDIVTRAMWSNGQSNLLSFFINPALTADQLKYYIEVMNTGSDADCAAEPQFSIAFGNRNGSGSEDQGVQTNDTPTRAIYSQYKMLCLDGDDAFTIGGESTDSIYVININRARYKDYVDEGNWQLNLQALTGYNFNKSVDNGFTGSAWDYTGSNIAVDPVENIVSLIDDSRINDPEITSAGEVYNIVSGSLENYNVNGGVYTTGSPAAPVVYGLFYRRLGVLVLDAKKLDDNLFFGTVIENETGGGEIDGDNNKKMFMSISGSAIYTDGSGDPLGFQARSAEVVKSTHYFIRLKNQEYNFSNNPTFVTGSAGDLKHPTMINDPKVYVTTVGLFNNAKELLAVAKLSTPFRKEFNREAVLRVKLEY